MEQNTSSPTPPVEESPVDEPPAGEPPAEEPLVEESPAVAVLDAWAGQAFGVLDVLDPLAGAPDQTLLDVVLAAEAARRAIDAVTTAVLGELHARGTTDVVAGLGTARWLADRCGTSPAVARRRVRVADTIRRELPATEAALRDPELLAPSGEPHAPAGGPRRAFGFDHAAVFADVVNPRILEEFRLLEAELILMAADMTFDAWRTHVRVVAALLDQDGGYDPDADLESNRLTVRPGPDGTIISGTLLGEYAVTVTDTLEQLTRELADRYRLDAEATGAAIPSPSTLRALALAEMAHRALTAAGGREAKVEATLVVHADDPELVYDSNDIAHRREAVAAMLCDAEIVPIIVDRLGVPLDIGRSERLYNRAQRRALARRDGGCVFPGCDVRPERCQAHHVDEWEHGGHTDVARGVLLCRHHHGVVHRTGWRLDVTADGWAHVTTPARSRLWGQRHHRRRTGPLPARPPAGLTTLPPQGPCQRAPGRSPTS